MKVAALTKGGEIPVLAILLVAVEVVGSEHVASGTVIGVVAPLTTVAGLIFYPGGNLVPVVRVAVTHFLTLLGRSLWLPFAVEDCFSNSHARLLFKLPSLLLQERGRGSTPPPVLLPYR